MKFFTHLNSGSFMVVLIYQGIYKELPSLSIVSGASETLNKSLLSEEIECKQGD